MPPRHATAHNNIISPREKKRKKSKRFSSNEVEGDCQGFAKIKYYPK